MTWLGDFAEDATVHFMWDTVYSSGASVTRATDGSIRIYKDNGTDQKTTANGITDTEDFDSMTGVHVLTIDTSNDTGDSGFWVTGSNYTVVLQGAVIDGNTVNAVLCHFSIENRTQEVDGITDAAAAKIADVILRRSFSTAESSSDGDALGQHSAIGALAKLANRVHNDANARRMTTYKADDKTTFYTQSITSSPSADPITGVG